MKLGHSHTFPPESRLEILWWRKQSFRHHRPSSRDALGFRHCLMTQVGWPFLARALNSPWTYSTVFVGCLGGVSEKEMATHSSILACSSWTEEPGGLLSMGLHGVGHDWSDLAAAAWWGVGIDFRWHWFKNARIDGTEEGNYGIPSWNRSYY